MWITVTKGYCWVLLSIPGILVSFHRLEHRAGGPVMVEAWLPSHFPLPGTFIDRSVLFPPNVSGKKDKQSIGVHLRFGGCQWSFCSIAVVLQGSRRPWDHRRVSSTPAICCHLLFTPLRFGVTPHQLTREIIREKHVLGIPCHTYQYKVSL